MQKSIKFQRFVRRAMSNELNWKLNAVRLNFLCSLS